MPTVPRSPAVPWSVAWRSSALAFYSTASPHDHFRTSTHAGDALGTALASLLGSVDASLGCPDVVDVVDVGAGSGELLTSLLRALPASLAGRVRCTGVDLRPRSVGLDDRVTWLIGDAAAVVPHGLRGLLVAHELLDDVPCDVVSVDSAGVPRLVLVDPSGAESLGPSLTDDDGWAAYGLSAARARAWLSAWWPLASVGDRAEIGLARDDLWTSLVSRLDAGTALAIDYGHLRSARPDHGSLSAYSSGRRVAALPDGSCNLTAHVAADALAHRVGADVVRQRDALLALGLSASLPDPSLAVSDPSSYADALAAASHAAELLDPHGLGAFWWIRTDV